MSIRKKHQKAVKELTGSAVAAATYLFMTHDKYKY